MSLVAINAGSAYHIESLEGPRYARFFDRVVPPEAVTMVGPGDTLLVPCRTPADRLLPYADALRTHLEGGGTIVAMGESHSHLWLPGIRFTPVPTNWWWWLEPGADLGVRIAAPGHPLFRRISQDACSWHLHGHFDPPAGVETLLVEGQGRPILYIDRVTTAGTMIVTSLDPFYHHGSHFMPATTRFLDGFLAWLREDVAG